MCALPIGKFIDSFLFLYLIIQGDKNTPICGVAKHSCAEQTEREMMKASFLESLKNAGSAKKRCNCLPACISVNYDIELSPSKYDLSEFHRGVDRTYDNYSK